MRRIGWSIVFYRSRVGIMLVVWSELFRSDLGVLIEYTIIRKVGRRRFIGVTRSRCVADLTSRLFVFSYIGFCVEWQ